jgi:hypothetical protein
MRPELGGSEDEIVSRLANPSFSGTLLLGRKRLVIGTAFVYTNGVTREGRKMEGMTMRRDRLITKIASGVLTVGMLIGIGIAAGSTANAAERDYGSRDRYHSSDFRDGHVRGSRDRDDRFHRDDRDFWYWVRDHRGHWVHERRSIDWGDGRYHR